MNLCNRQALQVFKLHKPVFEPLLQNLKELCRLPSSVFTGTPPDSLILESPFTNIREEAKSHPFSMVRKVPVHSQSIMYCLCATNKSRTDLGHWYMFIYYKCVTGLQISTRLWLVLPGFNYCKWHPICQWWEVGSSCLLFCLFLCKFKCDSLFTLCPPRETVKCLHITVSSQLCWDNNLGSLFCSILHAGGFIFLWEFVLETDLMWMLVYCKESTLVFSSTWPLILQT